MAHAKARDQHGATGLYIRRSGESDRTQNSRSLYSCKMFFHTNEFQRCEHITSVVSERTFERCSYGEFSRKGTGEAYG